MRVIWILYIVSFLISLGLLIGLTCTCSCINPLSLLPILLLLGFFIWIRRRYPLFSHHSSISLSILAISILVLLYCVFSPQVNPPNHTTETFTHTSTSSTDYECHLWRMKEQCEAGISSFHFQHRNAVGCPWRTVSQFLPVS